MPKETDTRFKVLEYIRGFIREHGYPPTVREIQLGLGFSSPRPIQHHLERLKRDGLIKHEPLKSRGIRPIDGSQLTEEVPLLGSIAAGQPIDVPAPDTWQIVAEGMVQVPPDLLPKNIQVFALRVKGKSMIDAFVDDGDIVILEATPTAETGQMVAAWLTDRQEATLKKIYYEPSRIRLQPANDSMEPIYVDPDNLLIQGRVIAVLRKYELGLS